MAHKRKRGKGWAYIIKRADVLPKPLHLTFDGAWGFDYEVIVLVGRNGFSFRYLVAEGLCRRAITQSVSRSTVADAFRDGHNFASNHIIEVLSQSWATRARSAA